MPDTTLSALFPSVPVTIGAERLQLRPVILEELPAVERVVEGWQTLIATGGDFLQAEAWEDFVDLCAAAVSRPRTWIDALAEEDFEKLICQVIAINEEIWKPEEQAGEVFKWSEIAQRLVEHGHPFDAIQSFTLSQARAFLRECFRMENEAQARDIESASFSMTDGKTVSKVAKELRRG